MLCLLRYLENDHSKHCRPDDVGAGGLSALPVDYIYNNGTADMSKKTTKTLPIANKDGTYTIINGSKSYEKILGYFTTKTSTPDEVHQLGKKMLASLYPQVRYDVINTLFSSKSWLHDFNSRDFNLRFICLDLT